MWQYCVCLAQVAAVGYKNNFDVTRCLLPVTSLIQLKIHQPEVQLCMSVTNVIVCGVLSGWAPQLTVGVL